MADLTIIGPNLVGSDYTFHVHQTGCRDIAREVSRYMADKPWNGTFEDKASVVNDVYDFLGGEDSEDGDETLPWDRGYGNEFRFLPCVEVPDKA